MATSVVGNIKTLLTADSSQFEATLTKAAKRGHLFAIAVTGSFTIANKAFSLASAKVKEFSDYVWEGAKMAGEGQQKTASLALALKQVKDAANFKLNGETGLAAFVSLADELEEKTGASAESILDLQAQFARTGASSKDIEKATRAALDMSVAMGQAPVAAARRMIQATSGASAGLARFGVEMSAVEKGSKKSLGQVAKEIDNAFAGAAEKKAHTFKGRLDAIGNAAENMQKAWGAMIVRNAAFNKGMEIARQMIDRVTKVVSHMGPQMGQAITWVMGLIVEFSGWLISFGADIVDWGTNVYGTLKIIGMGVVGYLSKVWGVAIQLAGKATEISGQFFKRYAAIMESSFLPPFKLVGKAMGVIADQVIKLGGAADKGGEKLQDFSAQMIGGIRDEIKEAPKREASVKKVTDKVRALAEIVGRAGQEMRDAAGSAEELNDNLETGNGGKDSIVDPDKIKAAAKALRDLLAAGDPFREFANRQADALEDWNEKLKQGEINAEQHAMAIAKIGRNTAREEEKIVRERTDKLRSSEDFITKHKKDALEQRLEGIKDAAEKENQILNEMKEARLLTEEEVARKKAEIDQASREQQALAIEEQQAEYATAGINAAEAFANGFRSFLDSKDPKDLLKGMLGGLMAVLPLIMTAAGAGPLAAALVPGLAGLGSGFLHAGGEAKKRATPRLFHAGFTPPPSAGEIDTRLQTGEGVLSRAAMARIGSDRFAALANGYDSEGGTRITNNNIVAFDAPSYESSVDRIGDRVNVQRIAARRGAENREAVQKMVRPARYY
jgi:hypothetical protein